MKKHIILLSLVATCVEGISQPSHMQLGHFECSYQATNCHTRSKQRGSQLNLTYERLYQALRSSNMYVAKMLMVQWPPHSGQDERLVLSAYFMPPKGGHPNDACYYLVEQNDQGEWGWIDDSPPYKNKWRSFNEYRSPPD